METASFSLRQGLRDSAHQLGLVAFWRWWVGQLAPLVPAATRTALQRRRVRPVVEFDGTSAVLWLPRPANGKLAYAESARIDLRGDSAAVVQAGRAAIDRLPMMAYGGAISTPAVVVALGPSKVLRKRLVLPAAVEENLKQALAYDLDRHTPFRADELYFDAAVVDRDIVRREIVVDWAAARRTDVDQARRTAESFGATVISVAADSPGRDGAAALSRLNLLPESDRIDAAWWRRWRVWVPAALVIAAAVAATIVPIWQKRDSALELGRQVDQAQQQALAADALRTELERQIGDYNFMLAKKFGYASATQVIDDVTKLLPDDTWLTLFELKSTVRNKEPQRDLLLRGESGNAGHLVSLLEESKLFEQAAPRSPTTKIQPGPGEIFDLGAQLKPLPLPAATEQPPVAASKPAPEAPKSVAETAPPGAPGTNRDTAAAPAASAAQAVPAATASQAASAAVGAPAVTTPVAPPAANPAAAAQTSTAPAEQPSLPAWVAAPPPEAAAQPPADPVTAAAPAPGAPGQPAAASDASGAPPARAPNSNAPVAAGPRHANRADLSKPRRQ
jgi:general secretion pathway protein L